MFDHWPRRKTMLEKQNLLRKVSEKIQKHCMLACDKQRMFDELCFAKWPNGQTFCMASKSQMFTNNVWFLTWIYIYS